MSQIIPVHGNYQELESYRNCVIIYDGTVDFCNRFLRAGDRTRTVEKNSQREQALSLLREIYRDLAELDQPTLMEKVTDVAKILKNNL